MYKIGAELMCNRKLVLGASAASGTKGSVFLGRPWGDYARVIFQNSNLENMITAVGWEGTSCHVQSLISPLTDSSLGFITIDVQHPLWRVCQHQCCRDEGFVGEGFDECGGNFNYSADVFELG